MDRDDIFRITRGVRAKDKTSEREETGDYIEVVEFIKLAIAQEREAYERVCEERDAIVKDADKAYALLRQALGVLEENLEFVESYGENSGAYVEGTYIPTINALREQLGVTE